MRTLKDELTKVIGDKEMESEQKKAKTKLNNPRLTVAQVKKIRSLYKNGNKYTDIASHMGVTYGQVQRAVSSAKRMVNRTYKKVVPEVKKEESNFDNSVTWKQKYLKAVSLLVEHNIIEVNL